MSRGMQDYDPVSDCEAAVFFFEGGMNGSPLVFEYTNEVPCSEQ